MEAYIEGKELVQAQNPLELKQFSKLNFQSKQKVINKGRPTPELKGLLQNTGQKIGTHKKTVWRGTTFSAFPAFFFQPVTMSGLRWDIVT